MHARQTIDHPSTQTVLATLAHLGCATLSQLHALCFPQAFASTVRLGLIGLAEAGFFPGIIIYLTFWFRRKEQATAIALFGPESGAALVTVVGVLVEVPVMLSVCAVCNRTRDWFPAEGSARHAPSYFCVPATPAGQCWRRPHSIPSQGLSGAP